jgi:hypothetical protein
MKKSKRQIVGSLSMTLLLFGASVLARESVAKGWARAAGEEPPREKSNRDVDFREAAAWALLSGSMVGLARMLVRRTVGYKGTPTLKS